MGLFSSKSKTYVSSSAYPLGDDTGVKTNSRKNAVFNAILQKEDVGSAVVQNAVGGMGARLRRAFAYARDHHHWGVPQSGVMYSQTPDWSRIQELLESIENQKVTLESVVIGTEQYEWFARKWLHDTYGWNPSTKMFANPPTGVNANAMVSFDYSNGSVLAICVNTDNSVRIFSEAYPLNPGLSLYVTYTIGSISKQLLYKLGSGEYPTLDVLAKDPKISSPFFPAIPMRVDNVDITSEAYQETEGYKTSKKYLDFIGLDFEDIAEKVDENPNKNDIDFAFLVTGISLNAQTQECKEYIYHFVKWLENISTVSGTKYTNWRDEYPVEDSFQIYDGDRVSQFASQTSPPTNGLKIYSTIDRAKNYDAQIQWQYIDVTIKDGSIGKVGSYEVVLGESSLGAMPNKMVLDESTFYVRKQLDEDTYEEVKVVGLTHENYVYKGQSVVVTAHDSLSSLDEQESFILPLTMDVLNKMNLGKLNDLAQHAVHLVLNCYTIVKKKWWQSGAFKILLAIVSVILLVAFPPSGGLMGSMLSSVGTAVATATGLAVTSALVAYIAATVTVLASMVISSVISRVAVNMFGNRIGGFVAAIASFVAMNWGNLGQIAQGFVKQIRNIADLTAKQLINLSNTVLGMVKSVHDLYIGIQMDKVNKGFVDLKTESEKESEKLKKMIDTNLDTHLDMIDIYGFMDASNTQWESPNDFLTRTLLTGTDIAQITNRMITDFADINLHPNNIAA